MSSVRIRGVSDEVRTENTPHTKVHTERHQRDGRCGSCSVPGRGESTAVDVQQMCGHGSASICGTASEPQRRWLLAIWQLQEAKLLCY
jgi:hypothetical protein